MEKSAGQVLRGMDWYRDQLKSPEWKQFSRRMREEKGGFCHACKMAHKVMHVHHKAYEKGREPWAYKSHEVTLLCEDCHKMMHELLNDFRRFVFGNLTPMTFRMLNAALAVGVTHNDAVRFMDSLAEFASSTRNVENFARAWKVEKPPVDLEALKKLPPLPMPKKLTPPPIV